MDAKSRGGSMARIGNVPLKVFGVVMVCLMLAAVSVVAPEPARGASFSPGDKVVITHADPGTVGLAVRSSPAGGELARKYTGTSGTVISGPQTASLGGKSYTWWQVRWGDDGVQGWSAEFYPGGVTYLQKQTKPVSTKFSVGQRVSVINMGTYNYRLRGTPPVLQIQGSEHQGDTGTIVAPSNWSSPTYYGVPDFSGSRPLYKGPNSDYFYHFWYVRWSDGQTGWSAEGASDGDYLKAESTGYTLTTAVNPSTAGTVSPASGTTYVDGTSAVVSATASSGWAFDHWGGDAAGTTNPTTVVMNGDKSVTAYFRASTNQAPTCTLSADKNSGKASLEVTFSMTASDPDGVIGAWGLETTNDGEAEYSGLGYPPLTLSHTFNTPDNYNVKLVVMDDGGLGAWQVVTIVVGDNAPPGCSLSPSPSSGTAPVAVTFGVGASDPDGTIASWEFSAGDQSETMSGTGYPPATIQYTYAASGTWTAILGVTDDDGATSFCNVKISVTGSNQAPNRPDNIAPADGDYDVSLTPTLQSSAFSDPDGDGHSACQWQIRSTSGSYASPAHDSGSSPPVPSIGVPSGKLTYSTTYYWHVRYQDSRGAWSAYSTETSFTTVPIGAPLTATTNPVSDLTATSATLNGDLVSMGTATSVQVAFEWGLTTAYGNTTTPQTVTGTGAFSATISELTPGATYHFRAKAVEGGTTVLGDPEKTFSTPVETDTVAPAAVTSLAAAAAASSSVTLTWSATGDDGGTGTASTYDIRYSTAAITESNWALAIQCYGESAPNAAGSPETFTVTGLSADTAYFLAMKTADELQNWSTLSNVVSRKTEAVPTGPDAIWLARAIMSEASVGTQEERVAVGWTVLNRLSNGGFGSDIESVVEGGYAWNQEPTVAILALAGDLAERKISDPTHGATHFFSPRSMPKEGQSTEGFDVGGGLHEVPGLTVRVHFPSWTNTLTWIGELPNVRQAYFMFYTSNRQPGVPSALGAHKADGTGFIEMGGGTTERTIVFRAEVADPDGDQVKLQIELRQLDEYGCQFDDSKGGLKESTMVVSGSEAVAIASELVDADYHWRARVVDEHGACSQWLEFGDNPTCAADFRVCAALGATIETRLRQQVTYPPNLLSAESFSDAVVSVWTDFSSWITRTDLNDMYYDFYVAGMHYDSLRVNALIEARRAVNKGDVGRALEYLRKSETYQRASSLSFEAANDVFLGSLDAAETIAQGVKDGCQAAVKFGLKFVSPEGARVADLIYDAVDFCLDSYISGEDEAMKNFVIKRAIDALFNVPLQGLTYTDWLKNRTGAVVFPTLRTYVSSEELQWALSKVIKEAVPTIAEQLATDFVTAVVDKVLSMVSTLDVELHSPGELRVYDSVGQVVGLVNGSVVCQIPQSMYCNSTVTILCPHDSYSYEVAGTETGTYGLEVTSVSAGATTSFSATDIPVSANEVHRYSIDSSLLSQGKTGVTVTVDSDGDGGFERTVTADSELTVDEFRADASPRVHLWAYLVAAAGAIVGLGVLATALVLLLRRRQAR